MRKIILYIATSLNGKIARKDGSIDWLESMPNPDKEDYGFKPFFESVDTTIQGNTTYQQVMGWDIEFPYKGKKNYVLTTKAHPGKNPYVDFVNHHPEAFIENLKKQQGKDIWLIGGGKVNTLLLNAGLIDEICLFLMPILLSDGIDLFEGTPDLTNLHLMKEHRYKSGALELNYRIGNQKGLK